MSRDVFSKNKEKRPRTSSGDSNNSFVKNVTSRVSGYLPATITKWFSSPSSNTNGSTPAADATDSSTEDEAPESPTTIQPPAKRMRFSSGTDTNCGTSDIETLEISTSYTVQSPPGRTTFRRETNFVSTPIRSPEETTTTIDRLDKDNSTMLPEHTVSISGPSVSKKRKTLFGNQSQELSDASKRAYVKTSNNTAKDPRLPSFKPTLLGSPFYAGRTTYGGAASSYINRPNIMQRQNTTVKESTSNTDNNISHSARRVMELLESYSSPLMDAKRLPQYTRPTRQDLLKLNSNNASKSPYTKSFSYKTHEQHVPRMASILRLRQRSRLNDTTNAARQLIASHSSSSPDYFNYQPSSKSDQSETDGSSKLTTKVKSRLTRPARGESNALDTDSINPPDLPNAVLQIDPNNLPNFSIPEASNTTSLIDKTISVIRYEPKMVKAVETTNKLETSQSNNKYNFANPVRITSESPKTTPAPPQYAFGSPERSLETPIENKVSEPPKLVMENENKTASVSTDWECPECWINNKQDADKCVCCGFKQGAKPADKAKCSLNKLTDSQSNTDKCIDCEKVPVNNVSKPPKADTSKWTCNDCWINNEEAVDKCVCCGAKNPKGAISNVIVKNPDAGRLCSKCFAALSNGICSKCVEPVKPDKTFKAVLKSQADKWECEQCLVRNEGNRSKCICCETERRGKTGDPAVKKFNFGTVNTTFKFGIDPKVQEANLAKVAEKPAEVKDKIEESETNNNVLAKAPAFSFGIPAKKPEAQTDAPKEKTEEPPKVAFTFGIPKQNSVASNPAPMFGIPNKATDAFKTDTEVKDKPEEDKPVETAKTPSVIFGGISLPTNSTTTSQSIVIPPFTLEKKDAPSNPLSLPTTSAEAAPTLTFTAPKQAGLFGIASSAPASSISFSPVTTPASSAAMFQKTDNTPKTMSMFQKSESPATATVSLFQKSETPVAAAPPPAATAPMFNFGSTQSAQPQGDKAKFNFTFGGNKTDNMFKSTTFGAPTENNTAGNKFTLGNNTENPLTVVNSLAPTGNSLVSGSGLSVNPLGATNPLSPGNGLQVGSTDLTTRPGLFGAPVQKENMWSPPNNSAPNPFVTNVTSNSLPKPFTFGSSTPFNSTAPAFGANHTQTSSTPAFGSVAQPTVAFGGASQAAPAPAFGTSAQATSNIFGMPNQNSQPSMFSSPSQTASLFGSPQQPAAGSMQPPMGLFGRPNVGAAATFGTPNASIPSFEASSITPAQPAPFNFATPQPTGIFGFGQQQQQQQQHQQQQPAGLGTAQTGVYSFGAPGTPQSVQFNMGSAPMVGVRRMRKAVRRSSQR